MSELRQREPRVECPAFLAFVRRKPCCACHAPAPNQAAHLRMTDAAHPEKRSVGIGEKPSDRWCNPLCSSCHLDGPDAQHRGNEREFWQRVGINPFANATNLWGQFVRRANRSPEQRKRIVRRAKRIKRSPTVKFKRRNARHALSVLGIKVKRKWPSRSFSKGRKFQRRA